MRNKLEQIKQTWTYRNKLLIVILSLILALLIESEMITLPKLEAEETFYEKTTLVVQTTMESNIEKRAEELYIENKDMDMEKYRQQAIMEANEYLLEMTYKSPYVDYEALKERYGY